MDVYEKLKYIDEQEYESFNKAWDSKINVCAGSSPTLVGTPSRVSQRSNYPTDCKDREDEQYHETDHPHSTSSEDSDSLDDFSSDSTWPDVDIPGTWGTQGLEDNPWDNKTRPYHKTTTYQDLELNDAERTGILTDRIIAACSSYLDRSPETQMYVLCKVVLSKKSLNNINIIGYHHYLQYVDLSFNELTDVEILGQLPFLMYLNVSHNWLKTVLGFKPPFNLTYVNYSHNNIHKIDDLTNFWSIVHLDISHNRIGTIEGVQDLKYLRHLNLSYNKIECIENLNHMKLLTLDLQHNEIINFEHGENVGFRTLVDILHINLSHNYLNTLQLFIGVTGIQSISMVENGLDNLIEISHLRHLNFLTEIDFRDNPITTLKHYIEVCLNNIKSIYFLDGDLIDAATKVLVKTTYEVSPYWQAIRKSATTLLLQQINDPVLGPQIIPADQSSPPVIVLVGPPGSNKGKLVRLFCERNPKHTILGVSHTTREITQDEVNKQSYYFIDSMTFQDLAGAGEFISVSQTFGHSFALSQSEINKTYGKMGVLVLHMDVAGALTLRAKGLRCNLILAMPCTADLHRQWLEQKYYNWHQGSKYIGAVKVENCPSMARKFQTHTDQMQELSAKELLSEVMDIATNGNKDKSVHLDDIEQYRDTDSGSIESDKNDSDNEDVYDEFSAVKASGSSPRTSGILKTSGPNKEINYIHPLRGSVTFKNRDSIVEIMQPSHRIQSCRSVTFSDVHAAALSETFDIPSYSASEVVFHDSPEHHAGLLSVLSHAHVTKEEMDACPLTWNIQTDALQDIVEEIIKRRETLLEIHRLNPGLFRDVIFTDNVEDSLTSLQCVLKDCINTQPCMPQHYEYKTDAVYKAMVGARLEMLHKDIHSELSITKKQSSTMDKLITSSPLKSVLKGSKRHVIETMKQKHKQTYRLPSYTNMVPDELTSDSSSN